MDPLSITSSLTTAAQLAREVQALFIENEQSLSEEKGKALRHEKKQLLRIHDAAAELQHNLNRLVSNIITADRTMISTKSLVGIQPVLKDLSQTLTDAYDIVLSSSPTESKVRLGKSVRYRDAASAEEIGNDLFQEMFSAGYLGKRGLEASNQHDLFMSKHELPTEEELVEGYLVRLSFTQRRYFDKLLFESENIRHMCISTTNEQGAEGKILLKHLDEEFLNSANTDGIRTPMSKSAQGSNGLAIILCEASTRSSSTIPLRRGVFINVMERLAIPAGFHQAFLTGTPKSVFYVAEDTNPRRGFVLRTPFSGTENWTLALSWSSGATALRGIILGLQGPEKSRLAMLLKDTIAESAHPMNIPLILCEMLMESDSNGVKAHASDLYQVELRTNFHGYPLSSDTPSQLAKTPEKDFEDMTRSLNVIISRFAFHEMRIRANAVSIDQILSHISVGTTQQGFHPAPPLQSIQEAIKHPTPLVRSLQNRINHLQTEQRALLLEISCNQKIAQSQLQIVYNLIAQRDNKDSLAMAELQTELARIQTAIANTTKEDSYAMRTIAVMSIVFLPGTFVSSFFSMDMFDWQAPKGASVVSFRFWIYWAVTAPLTVMVVLIWFFWLRTHKKHEIEGRKDSTPANSQSEPIPEPTQNDTGKKSWFHRQRERVLPKDEEKHAIDAIRAVHQSFAAERLESTERSRTPTIQIQRQGTVLAGPTLPYVNGSTISQKARKTGMKKIGLSLDSICRREKIFTQNASDALDLLEGALSTAIDFHITATTTTDDEHKRLTAVVVAEPDTMKDKQGFFLLIEPFVSNVSDATGIPVPTVIAAAIQNVCFASNAVLFSIKISTRNTSSASQNGSTTTTSGVSASDAKNIDLDAPKQSDHQYLDELSYELHQQGLSYLHDQLEKMQRQVSPKYGLLLDNTAIIKLTHDLEGNVLHCIHSDALLLSNLPSKDWLDQKYEVGIQAEHTDLKDERRFLARARDEEMDNTEEISIPVRVDSIDAPLTQEELDIIQPLSAPPSLDDLPHSKRVHFMQCLFWAMKRKNHEAAAKLEERLLPSEILPMFKEQELAVLRRISDHMQSLHRAPTPAEIECEYDIQSEHELQDCSRLDRFVNKANEFHNSVKRFFTSAKEKVSGAFYISGASNVAPAARHASPPPLFRDVKGQFMTALKGAINKMNIDASNTWNGSQAILQPAQVDDLALKLEALMLNNLDQQRIGTPMTSQQQETLYIQADHEMLKQIEDVDCFVQTV
ncbi:unnamed protein product [Alternaria sp. RS040]